MIFSFPRRVAFGDCDPARIYYTPRAFGYCVEALGAWWESTLAVSWSDLLARRGLEVRILRAESEFLRPLTAGQEVRVEVRVSETGPDWLRFRLTGKGETGEPHFHAVLTAGLFNGARNIPVPISAGERERIRGYEAACGDEERGKAEGAGEERVPPPERRTFPGGLFTRTRRVVFGDCSPAGTVYLPKVFEYAVEAVGEWFEKIPRVSWLELVSVRMQGAPAVSASCVLHRPMTAGQEVAMGVRVPCLGRASIALSIEGNDPDGNPLFDSMATLCFIDQREGFRSMAIPEEFRGRILEYQAACGNGVGRSNRPGTSE